MPSFNKLDVLPYKRFRSTFGGNAGAPLTTHPVSFTQIFNSSDPDDIFLPLYRVKLWDIAIFIEGTTGSSHVGFTDDFNISFGSGYQNTSATAYTDEIQAMVCERGILQHDPATGPPPASITNEFKIMDLSGLGSVVYKYDPTTNLWWPQMTFHRSRNFNGVRVQVTTLPPSGAFDTILTASGTFLDKPITYVVSGASGGFTTITGSAFVVSAVEYWPFDRGDGGGPTFNNTTGDLLRSPYP